MKKALFGLSLLLIMALGIFCILDSIYNQSISFTRYNTIPKSGFEAVEIESTYDDVGGKTDNSLELHDYYEAHFKGKIISQLSMYYYVDSEVFFTYYEVEVTAFIKGDVADKVIIAVLGGVNYESKKILEVKDFPTIEFGLEYEFFCDRGQTKYEDITSNTSYILNTPNNFRCVL